MDDFDFHTHRLDAPAGKAIINLPREALLFPEDFSLRSGCLYSAGIHPWWTADEDVSGLFEGVSHWAAHPQVVAVGECGIDKLRGASMEEQLRWFACQAELAERFEKPIVVHCVKAFDLLVRMHRELSPRVLWVVHGFRGKPELAQMLLREGMHLSYGKFYNRESYRATPEACRHHETDEGG